MDAPITYIPNFVPNNGAVSFFSYLWKGLQWERRDGAPRREVWMNRLDKPYTYGRGRGERTYEPKPFDPIVNFIDAHIRVGANLLVGLPPFEGCFLNGYEDEHDSLGWHSDDDAGIDHSRPIAVVTLYGPLEEGLSGQNRIIQFKTLEGWDGISLNDERTPVSQELHHGSLLLMHPGMQQTHLHRIPKANFKARKRISLTYRGLLS